VPFSSSSPGKAQSQLRKSFGFISAAATLPHSRRMWQRR
jgi:hypothetical protein